jgi:uncharacterized protein YggU (UPF0235/DUF167 family)
VRVVVRLTPRARADRLDGIARLPDGAPVLRVSVRAPPLDNRANEALLRFLAKEWELPSGDFTIVGGQKSRNKLVHVAGDLAVLLSRLSAALAALPRK